jgi:Ca2+-binding RTX toxin-like protein
MTNIINGSPLSEKLRGYHDKDKISGLGGDDSIWSGHGRDTVDGGIGHDIIYNDRGNDVFLGGEGRDTMSFIYVNAGHDPADKMVYKGGVVFDLAKTTQTIGIFGTDTYSGFENATGSGGGDTLYGNKHANRLDGAYGNDKLYGRTGLDTILGGKGEDTIIGGKGADKLGGTLLHLESDDGQQDIFRYKALNESRTDLAGRDTIWGRFDGAGDEGDCIDLHLIDANGGHKAGNGKFQFIGSMDFATDRIGEVQVRKLGSGDTYLVLIDTDTDNAAEMAILVHSKTALTSSDFIL